MKNFFLILFLCGWYLTAGAQDREYVIVGHGGAVEALEDDLEKGRQR